jgi:hypothetical protein
MALRRQPPTPEPCGCEQRIAELEQTIAALAATVVTLRPRHKWQTAEQGLIDWGARPDDARLIAQALAWRTRTT